MYAVASLLDPAADQAVRDVWYRFEAKCGLTGIKITPLPHFSWQGAETYQLEQTSHVLEEVASRMQPFTVRAAGLGMFTGPRPVVYIALVKDEQMLAMNKLLWERLAPYMKAANGYYHPTQWVPHITLAFHEYHPDRLACAVEDIAFEKIDFKIVVDHFAMIFQVDGNAGLYSKFPFGEIIVSEGGNNEDSGISPRFTR